MEKVKNNSQKIMMTVSVILAVILWAYVAYQENPDMTRWVKNVPITVVGTDDLDESGYSVVSVDRSTVDVKLKGDRMSLAKLTSDDISVKLDISKIRREGETTLVCDITSDKKNVDVTDSKHNSVVVTTEEIVTDVFSVNTNIVGSPSTGYKVFNPTVSYDEITVRGAKSVVNSIASVSTKSVSVSGVSNGSSVVVGLTAFDGEGTAVSGVSFTPAAVEVSYTVYKEKTVSVDASLTNIPIDKDVTASPDTVKIYALADALASVTEVKTEPIDVSALGDGDTVKAKLILPDGAVLADGTQTVELTLKVAELSTVEAEVAAET